MTKFLYKRVYFKVKIVTVKMLWVLVTGRDIAFLLSYWRFVHSDNWQRKRLVHSSYRVKGWYTQVIARVLPKYSMESGQEKWNECNE